VAGAEGYWRWAFRPGAGRQLYRALWTGVAGWLMAGRTTSAPGLDPRRRVVERGRPLSWRVPDAADSLLLEIEREGSAVAWRGAVAGGDSAAVALAPGRYRYVARAYRGGRVTAATEGPAEVEEFSAELLPAPGESLRDALQAAAPPEVPGPLRRPRRLATLGWPYLVLIALFCAEWAVRRFSGLR
jgi:hypothetical protein